MVPSRQDKRCAGSVISIKPIAEKLKETASKSAGRKVGGSQGHGQVSESAEATAPSARSQLEMSGNTGWDHAYAKYAECGSTEPREFK